MDHPGENLSNKILLKPSTATASSGSQPMPIASPLNCLVDGAMLLETEQVLLRAAPHLLSYTGRIRREGRVEMHPEVGHSGFRQYNVTVSLEAVKQITDALELAVLSFEASKPLQKLVLGWREVFQRCSQCGHKS